MAKSTDQRADHPAGALSEAEACAGDADVDDLRPWRRRTLSGSWARFSPVTGGKMRVRTSWLSSREALLLRRLGFRRRGYGGCEWVGPRRELGAKLCALSDVFARSIEGTTRAAPGKLAEVDPDPDIFDQMHQRNAVGTLLRWERCTLGGSWMRLEPVGCDRTRIETSWLPASAGEVLERDGLRRRKDGACVWVGPHPDLRAKLHAVASALAEWAG